MNEFFSIIMMDIDAYVVILLSCFFTIVGFLLMDIGLEHYKSAGYSDNIKKDVIKIIAGIILFVFGATIVWTYVVFVFLQ